MTPQICYTLTTSDRDYYAEMAYLSASLARRIYPAARIVVLCDELTTPKLVRHSARVLKVADQVITVRTGIEPHLPRNRFVKTGVRQHLKGAFVFLDADTLPIREFDALFAPKADLAGTLDRYCGSAAANNRLDWIQPIYQQFGWKYPTRRYFNAGVVYFADTAMAHAVGQAWHESWLKFWAATGQHEDQPAYNHVIDELKPRIRVMSIPYNAMISAASSFARGGRIFHYFAGGGQLRRQSLLAHLLDHLALTGEIDWKAVERAARLSDPWVTPDHEPYWDPYWHPAHVQYTRWVGQAIRQRDTDAALRHLREAIVRGPKVWPSLRQLGRFMVRQLTPGKRS